MKVYVVTPALDEAENLRTALPAVCAALAALRRDFEVCVVDDGSTDDTVPLCQRLGKQLPIHVVSHPTNLGVDAAFTTGFAWALARARDEDAVVTMEADNTADLSILPDLLAKLEGGAELVLASCYAPGGQIVGTNAHRRLLSHLANWLLRVSFSLHEIHTYSAFYRAYRAGLLRRAYTAFDGKLIECKGFVCMVEVVAKMHLLTSAIEEVPTVLRADLREGTSKMRVPKTIWGYLKFIWHAKAGQGRQVFAAAARANAPCAQSRSH